jgi:hypothetical protein
MLAIGKNERRTAATEAERSTSVAGRLPHRWALLSDITQGISSISNAIVVGVV